MERNTSQKQIILDYLKSAKCHPGAEDVYLAVRKKLPNISKATVYRILKNYKQKGKVREILADTNHYDGDISEHAHFICQKCKKIFDVFEFPQKLKFNKNTSVGQIKSYQVYFYGFCRKCYKKQKNNAYVKSRQPN